MANKRNLFLGIACIVISSLGFALNQAISNAIGARVGVFQKMTIHNLVGMVVFFFILLKTKEGFVGKSKSLIFLRALFGCLSTIFVVVATTYSKRSAFEIGVLTSTAAIFTMLFAGLILREKIRLPQYLAIVICFLGVVIIVNPNASFLIDPFAIFALFGALAAGLAYCIVRKLKGLASPNTLVFFYSTFCVVVSLPLFLIKEIYLEQGSFCSLQDFFWLLGMGVCATMGQLFLGWAYKFAEASKISPFSYSQNIFSLLISLIILKQSIAWYAYLGATLIIMANLFNVFYNNWQIKKYLQNEVGGYSDEYSTGKVATSENNSS